MSSLKIFIVDDASSIRSSLIKMLNNLEYVEIIAEADSIAAAKNLLAFIKPDLTLLDLNLPDGNGYEILQLIKQSNEAHTVIVLTNYSAESYKIKAINEGADYFFDKSTEFEKVIDIISHLEK